MAYAAVLSLNQNLEQISNSHLEQHQTPLQDQQIKSLQEKLSFLLDFLDDSWQRRSEELRCLEREIRDAAYKAEDLVESHIYKNFGEEGFLERQMRDQTFWVNFEIVADQIDFIKTKAAKLKESWDLTDLHQNQRTSVPTGSSRLASMGKNDMVGFRKDLMEIMERLIRNQDPLQIIQVTGMGGIGKTTLARNVYNHHYIEHHFHIRAWVSISEEYCEREVLLSLLESMIHLSAEMRQESNTEELKEYLYKRLKRNKYLIVMDDVWTTKAWDFLRMIFPDDRIGSRIMLTTRLSSVVDSADQSFSYHMQFLDETDSWNLLRREVFGDGSCSPELEETGKEISKNCKGLPLSLVVIGGHLSKAIRTKDHWEYVAENVKSVVNDADEKCSEILSLSYDYLPHYLKACFLYMGVFPEDEIRVSKLIKLWAAEGFLKPVTGKTLEEVAEEYLGDLISRNLILISEKSSTGKIKTCSIHDMLRVLCIRKAQEEMFFHIVGKDVNIFAEGIKYSRGLCIHPWDTFHKELSNCDNLNVYPSMGSLAPVRSILCSVFASEIYKSSDGKLFPLLRVLDLKRKLGWDLIGEIKLVHSRYLSFSSFKKISIPKTLPDSLWFLQTLIVDCKKVHLPEVIWRIPQLRHLLFGRCYLPCPARSPIDGESIGLGNLLTLSKVSSSSCTEEVFERVPNLNKLGIFVENFEMRPFFLLNLVNLPRLETLKITSGIYSDVSVLMNLTFPPNIKKLTLEGCHIPWKNMTIIGSMPNLEALKLQLYACHGPEWEPREGEFCKLKFLLLENIDLAQWRAYDTNFTKLERLILRRCFKLEEIPPSIGEVSALEIIDLDDASPSAVTSAEQIQEEQKDYGHDIKVRVLDMFHLKRLKQEKAEAQIMAKVWSNEDTLQLEATAQFCGLLFDSIPLSKELISGVVPRLVEFLARNDYPQLQCKAAEAITSISNGSSDNINIMIDHGAVPVLVSLLSSPEDVLREQALHLLGNFAGDSTKSRDLILSYGVLMPLLAQFNDKTKLSIMRKGTRTLSNICEGKTWPQFKQVKSAILPLAHLIHIDDEEVLNSACWALLRLSYRKKDIIQAGVFPRLVELLLYPSLFVLIPAMCIVHNIISDVDDIQIQVIIDKGALPCLLNLLTQNYEYMVKKATCWIITQVIQRTKDNIQAVIEAGIFSPLVQLLQNAEFGLQDAAAWAIFNATMGGSNEQIKFLVDKGCIKPLCDLLVSRNTANIIKYCLGGLENILKVGEAEKKKGNTEDVNVFAQIIEDVGGLQKIENLQTHDYGNVRRSAIEILVTYWHQEDDNDEDSDDDNNDDNDDEDVDDYDDDDNAADDDEDDNDEDSDSKANSLS